MRMNRRNVLVGLGTIVAGGGGALATGAFSSVEADRAASLSVADDSSALLTLNGDTSSSLISENNGVLEINQSSINLKATTSVNQCLEIVNNSSQDFQLSVNPTPGTDVTGTQAEAIFSLEYVQTASDSSMIYSDSIGGTSASDGHDLVSDGVLYFESNASGVFDLIINTTVAEADGLGDGNIILDEITFKAE